MTTFTRTPSTRAAGVAAAGGFGGGTGGGTGGATVGARAEDDDATGLTQGSIDRQLVDDETITSEHVSQMIGYVSDQLTFARTVPR